MREILGNISPLTRAGIPLPWDFSLLNPLGSENSQNPSPEGHSCMGVAPKGMSPAHFGNVPSTFRECPCTDRPCPHIPAGSSSRVPAALWEQPRPQRDRAPKFLKPAGSLCDSNGSGNSWRQSWERIQGQSSACGLVGCRDPRMCWGWRDGGSPGSGGLRGAVWVLPGVP